MRAAVKGDYTAIGVVMADSGNPVRINGVSWMLYESPRGYYVIRRKNAMLCVEMSADVKAACADNAVQWRLVMDKLRAVAIKRARALTAKRNNSNY